MRDRTAAVLVAGLVVLGGCGLLEPNREDLKATATIVAVSATPDGYSVTVEVRNQGEADLFMRTCRGVESRSSGSWAAEKRMSGGCSSAAPVRVFAHEFTRIDSEFHSSSLPLDRMDKEFRLVFVVSDENGVAPRLERVLRTEPFSLN